MSKTEALNEGRVERSFQGERRERVSVSVVEIWARSADLANCLQFIFVCLLK